MAYTVAEIARYVLIFHHVTNVLSLSLILLRLNTLQDSIALSISYFQIFHIINSVNESKILNGII